MENASLKGRDIIMLGIQPWDLQIGHNFKNMAKVICKNNRVLYVNRPLDHITKWKEPEDIKTKNRLNSIKNNTNVLQEIEPGLHIFNPQTILSSINFLPHNFLYKFLNRRNNRKLASEIKKGSQKLGFKNPILFIDNDFYNGLYLAELLDVDCSVYYLRDYLLAQPYFNKHGKFSEPELIEKSDVIVTNSLYLNNYAKNYNNMSFYTGQGCGDDYFQNPGYVPEELKKLQGPVIGYCGFLTSMRLDIALLEFLAKQKPEWNFVLVGPEDDDFKKSTLHNFKNVLFTGSKNEGDLPAFVHNFDVCLNPQVVNQLTIGNYPRKVDEYLAAGKPVVATLTETMEAFADCTFLCSDQNEYLAAINQALISDSDENKNYRIKIARSHSWENTVEKVYEAINNFLIKANG